MNIYLKWEKKSQKITKLKQTWKTLQASQNTEKEHNMFIN